MLLPTHNPDRFSLWPSGERRVRRTHAASSLFALLLLAAAGLLRAGQASGKRRHSGAERTAWNCRFWTRPASRARTSTITPAASGWPRIPFHPRIRAGAASTSWRKEIANCFTRFWKRAAANTQAAPGSNEQKIGDFYASCMDEKQINADGAKPLDPEFARIDAIRSTARTAGGSCAAARHGRSRAV